MSDNTSINAASSVIVPVASDDIGGVQYQRNKVNFGPDGSATDVSLVNPLPTRPDKQWSVVHAPAVNTIATASRAASANVQHVCTGMVASVYTTAAPSVTALELLLRDGATGVGTVIFQVGTALQAVSGDRVLIHLGGLQIAGTVGNAMTLEFSVAGGANTFERITLIGYDS